MNDNPARTSAVERADSRAGHGENPRYVRRVLIAVAIAAAVVVSLLVLWYAADVFLVIFAGILLAVLLDGLSAVVSRYTRLPHRAALAMVVVALAVLIGLGAALVGTTLASQFDQLTESAGKSMQQFQEHLQRYQWGRQVLAQTQSPGGLASQGGSLLNRVTRVFSSTVGALGSAVIILFLGLYLAADPEQYRQGVLRLTPASRRERGQEVLNELGATLRGWLVGQFVAMTVVGVSTGVGLWLLGIPLALALALIAFVLSFVPYLGPIVSAVPAVLVALTMGPSQALYVVLLYVGVQTVESYLITPLVQQKAVDLPPALTIGAQLLMGVLFGMMGILVATPLTAAALVLVKMLYVENVLEHPGSTQGDT